MVSEEIPGKIGEYDDNYFIEVSNSVDPLETKHYLLITPEQYEANIKKAFEAGCIMTFQEDLGTSKLPTQSGMDELYEEWKKEGNNESSDEKRGGTK